MNRVEYVKLRLNGRIFMFKSKIYYTKWMIHFFLIASSWRDRYEILHCFFTGDLVRAEEYLKSRGHIE